MPDPSPVLDYFDDEGEVSVNEFPANANDSDVMDDSAIMDYGIWPENQNNNNECSPSVSGFLSRNNFLLESEYFIFFPNRNERKSDLIS